MNEEGFLQALAAENIELTEWQQQQFQTYYELLVEWNEKVNLTAITEQQEVYLKHFYDSISPLFRFPIQDGQHICDIGAGAGFPSLPMLIVQPGLHVTIVDALKKRITFLEELVEKLSLKNVSFVHGRAEDIGQKPQYREQFDIVTARAVARMSVLAEYCLPLCKLNGTFIALKGASADEEILDAKRAFSILGAGEQQEYRFQLPQEESERSIIYVEKCKQTPKKYPRKAGTPAKSPIS